MTWKLCTTEEVERIHDRVLNPGELPGLAGDKSLSGALGRVEFRIQYGLIADEFDPRVRGNPFCALRIG